MSPTADDHLGKKTHKDMKTGVDYKEEAFKDLLEESPFLKDILESLLRLEDKVLLDMEEKVRESTLSSLRGGGVTQEDEDETQEDMMEDDSLTEDEDETHKDMWFTYRSPGCDNKSVKVEPSKGVECPACHQPKKQLIRHIKTEQKCREKLSHIDLESFQKQLKAFRQKITDKAYKAKKWDEDEEKVKEQQRTWKKNSRETESEEDAIYNFRRKCIFGPIFICVSCEKRHFENNVTTIDGLWEQIEEKTPGLWERCIPVLGPDTRVKINIKGQPSTNKQYICHACKRHMKAGNMPPMCTMNGLLTEPLSGPAPLSQLKKQIYIKHQVSRPAYCHHTLISVNNCFSSER